MGVEEAKLRQEDLVRVTEAARMVVQAEGNRMVTEMKNCGN